MQKLLQILTKTDKKVSVFALYSYWSSLKTETLKTPKRNVNNQNAKTDTLYHNNISDRYNPPGAEQCKGFIIFVSFRTYTGQYEQAKPIKMKTDETNTEQCEHSDFYILM